MMRRDRRWVVDTNLLVSHLLLPDSLPGRAVRKAVESGEILVSDATLSELVEVLGRSKFDKYLDPGDREQFFSLFARVAVRIEVTRVVSACRDPKDDRFLEVAVNGIADAILTGDQDLLVLHPFLGVPILSPHQFLGLVD